MDDVWTDPQIHTVDGQGFGMIIILFCFIPVVFGINNVLLDSFLFGGSVKFVTWFVIGRRGKLGDRWHKCIFGEPRLQLHLHWPWAQELWSSETRQLWHTDAVVGCYGKAL